MCGVQQERASTACKELRQPEMSQRGSPPSAPDRQRLGCTAGTHHTLALDSTPSAATLCARRTSYRGRRLQRQLSRKADITAVRGRCKMDGGRAWPARAARAIDHSISATSPGSQLPSDSPLWSRSDIVAGRPSTSPGICSHLASRGYYLACRLAYLDSPFNLPPALITFRLIAPGLAARSQLAELLLLGGF